MSDSDRVSFRLGDLSEPLAAWCESTGQTVTVDESDTCRIHELVDSAVTGDWDYSHENRGDDGCEVLDVYSLAEAADQWRIRVTFAS